MNAEHPSDWRSAESPQPTPAPPQRRGNRSSLAATVVGVALFGALIGFAADRWAVSNVSQNPLGSIVPTVTSTGPRTGPIAAPNGGTTAQAAPTATTATSPDQQAIQQVIQRGADEH